MGPAQQAIDQYLQGLVAADLDAIVAIYADNATIEDPIGADLVVGKKAIRAFYEKAAMKINSAVLTGPIRETPTETAFSFELQFDVQGKPFAMDIIDVFKFDQEGKVVSMRAFWSQANMRPSSS
jgi:steroid delta-isomerase